ncbi:hypothetical protein H4S02_002364 [Coemansia sp. RSA 2611]|nr:hypothetical protein IWW54_001829 [Coemansia sp. RSA 2705]KAJ2389450.1 hypothetical protein H4S02_002364 [Coemansia sp. RSA 2611]
MGSSLMSPLKSTLKHELDINNTQWASLISMVWVVGTISPFIAGLLLDMMGAPLAGAVAILMILLGNGVCAIAVGARKLSIFLAGRAIYSLGGGAVFLVGEVILLKWFKGRQLPVAFGCISTMGGLMAFSGPATVSAVLSNNENITVPFWLATGLSAFGLLCFGVYGIIHRSHYARDIELVDPATPASDTETDFASARSFVSKPYVEECSIDKLHDKAARRDSKQYAEPLPEFDLFSTADSAMDIGTLSQASVVESRSVIARARAKCKHLLTSLAALPETYWYVLLCISIQGTLFIPLHEIIPEMMETEWGYTRAQSSKLFVYLHIIPIVMHISLGVLINRIGHRISMFFVGSVLVFMASVFITYVRRVPILVSLIMMNLSGSMVPAAIFSLTNLVIDNGEVAGAALGLIRSAEFASVTLMEMLDGLLQDADHNRYDTVLIGLVIFAGLLLLVGIVSIIVDYMANGGRLNSANPYVSPQPATNTHAVAKSATGQNILTAADREDSNVTAGATLVAVPVSQLAIPKRRYIYMGIIGLLLATSWTLFIMLLTKV